MDVSCLFTRSVRYCQHCAAERALNKPTLGQTNRPKDWDAYNVAFSDQAGAAPLPPPPVIAMDGRVIFIPPCLICVENL